VKQDVAVYIECERCGRRYVSVQAVAARTNRPVSAHRLLEVRLGPRPERHLIGRACPKCGWHQSWMLANEVRRHSRRWGWTLAVVGAVVSGLMLFGSGSPVWAANDVLRAACIAGAALLAGALAVVTVRLLCRRQLSACRQYAPKQPRWGIAPIRD
jgi:hypothetical protein